MKNIVLIVALLFFGNAITVLAQTNNAALVDDIYQRASTFYDSGKYQEAVTLLDRAEKIAGAPDARILYLKVKVLSALTRQNTNYAEPLTQVLAAFKTTASQQNFDAAKVQEINNLEQQIAQTQTELKSRQQAERNDFERAKASKSILQLDSFLSKYPNSAYTNEVSTVKKAVQQEKSAELLRQLDADLAKANRKIGSGRFMTVMGVLTTLGWGLWVNNYIQRENAKGSYSDPGITEGIIGSCAGIIPVAFFISGGTKKKEGKAMKREIEQKRPTILMQNAALSPTFNNQYNQAQYGVALRIRF